MAETITKETLPTAIKTDIMKVLQANQGNKLTTELVFGLHAQMSAIVSNGFKILDEITEPTCEG